MDSTICPAGCWPCGACLGASNCGCPGRAGGCWPGGCCAGVGSTCGASNGLFAGAGLGGCACGGCCGGVCCCDPAGGVGGGCCCGVCAASGAMLPAQRQA